MALNHFLETPILVYKDKFIKAIEVLLNKYAVSIDLANDLRKNYLWAKDSLYPYRNIVHHMGGIALRVGRKNPTNTAMKLVVTETEIKCNRYIHDDLKVSNQKTFILIYIIETDRWNLIYLDPINKIEGQIPKSNIIEKLLFSASEIIRKKNRSRDFHQSITS